MGLNIKNERTVALVTELAALTGASTTSAIEDAVRRRVDELAGDGELTASVAARRRTADRLLEGIRASIAGTPGTWREYERTELYDERGVPR
ncbi:type II toxin-antitoxin system VapB family antitoxin [uncultured Microbacterium sp.]|uniref:type II toxin-antitoxin system VapB family antitoxin n=1 Tax=uncultured Microbacterium sp. TaxID=191216 RepID=UPI0026384BA9|nr:type II toxin-antitoxin system VapB family antitoxin [uncultured Microbacterium sp.]